MKQNRTECNIRSGFLRNTKHKGRKFMANLQTALNGFLFGTGFILAAMLFKAVLHTGICGG
jgi:hypothetical protein